MIRVSTNTIFDQGVFNLQRGQSTLAELQDQISTSRRVRTPADDPVAAARSLEVEQSQAISEQYIRNGDSAQTALGLSENALISVTTLIQDVRTLAVNAGDGALSEKELKSLAVELRARYQDLLGLANSTDGNGQYLFSGYQGATRPFAETAPGLVSYAGDQGARLVQVSASRQIPVSDAGSDVFQAIRNGNGTFVTAAATANTGTGIVSPGTVVNQTAWDAAGNPRDFTVVFDVDSSTVPPTTTYDLIDNLSGLSLTTGAAPGAGPYLRTYTDGAGINLSRQAPPDTNPASFDFGAQLTIEGQPADGDSFTVQASTNQDLFKTIHDLITTLETRRRKRCRQRPTDQWHQHRAFQPRQQPGQCPAGALGDRRAPARSGRHAVRPVRPGPATPDHGVRTARSGLCQGHLRPHPPAADLRSCPEVLRAGAGAVAVRFPLEPNRRGAEA